MFSLIIFSDHSSFDHYFKKRFRESEDQYRLWIEIPPLLQSMSHSRSIGKKSYITLGNTSEQFCLARRMLRSHQTRLVSQIYVRRLSFGARQICWLTHIWVHEIIQRFSQYDELHHLLQEVHLSVVLHSVCDPVWQHFMFCMSQRRKNKNNNVSVWRIKISWSSGEWSHSLPQGFSSYTNTHTNCVL